MKIGIYIVELFIYVCLSAVGVSIIKLGLNKRSEVIFDKNGLSISFSWILLLGIILYILSFLASLIVMKNMNLSVYYPVSAGLIYIMVCILSVALLKERISRYQLIGMVFIFLGIVVMNLNSIKN